MIDRIFQGVKAYATDREGATEARCSGKKTCTPEGGNWKLATSGSRRAAQWCRAQAAEGKNKLPQRKNPGWTPYQSATKKK